MRRTVCSIAATIGIVLGFSTWSDAQDRRPGATADPSAVIQTWKAMPRQVAEKLIAKKGFRFNVPKVAQGDRDKPSGPVGTSGR